MAQYRVDNRNDLIKAFDKMVPIYKQNNVNNDDFDMYCPTCSRVLRVSVRVLNGYGTLFSPVEGSLLSDRPFIYECTCVNCRNKAFVLLYPRENHHDIAVIYSKSSMFATPNAKPEVMYYLDQAQRAHSMGANSAAVAMFRSALEQLLFHEGYRDGMLNQKLKDLQNGISANNAPKWAMELDTEFLDVIKQLGNTSIHPNDGDISVQDKLDSDLVAALQTTFLEILDMVYEEPARKAARKALLKAATGKTP